MARPTHDIVATLGEYTAADGTKKKRYHTCGKAFTNDQGQVSLKLDALPCSPEWSGWLSLYPVKDTPPADPRPAARPAARTMVVVPVEDDEEIPF